MADLLSSYPYLVASLALLSIAAVALWIRPEHRRGMVWSGLLSAPCAMYAIIFVPEYWHPRQIFRFLAGPEDVIFSFANGVMVWAMVANGELRIENRPRWTRTAGRITVVTALFLVPWGVLVQLGLRLMDAACTSAACTLVLLLIRRPGQWRAAVRGGALFSIYYTLVLGALSVVDPALFGPWNPAALSGLRLGPIPVEEIVWGALFGAVWPSLVSFLTEPPGGAETVAS